MTRIPFDVFSSRVRLQPLGEVATEFPLAEFVRISDDDTVPLVCSMTVMDSDFHQMEMWTAMTVTFRGRLGTQAIQGVTDELGAMIAGGDERSRATAVRSLRVLGSAAAVPLLKKGIVDRSDRVGWWAVVVAADLDAVAVLEQAAKSRNEVVRIAGRYELKRRKTGRSH